MGLRGSGVPEEHTEFLLFSLNPPPAPWRPSSGSLSTGRAVRESRFPLGTFSLAPPKPRQLSRRLREAPPGGGPGSRTPPCGRRWLVSCRQGRWPSELHVAEPDGLGGRSRPASPGGHGFTPQGTAATPTRVETPPSPAGTRLWRGTGNRWR
ncbi:hypothetical protein HJG60_010738 [Phyllostomus discolor]|uniref:Uncharacterized protein n=1 Tax=Phyllostomus discolor TaxID=89673 RepID=A0A834ADE2_9CHIR|nr:hypothetical protein HJG60_010738 [Phyllostomus discolor]